MKLKITERGWAGHFICAHDCWFRRNTLIEYGDTKLVVSTVGNMHYPNKEGKMEEIGYKRYYETVCFWGKKDGCYIEADTHRGEISIKGRQGIYDTDIDKKDIDNIANDVHEEVVKEMSERITNGDMKTIREEE